jgi:hypothetical protein
VSKPLRERLRLKIKMLRTLETRSVKLERKIADLQRANDVIKRYEAMLKLLSEYNSQQRNIEISIANMLVSNASAEGEVHI